MKKFCSIIAITFGALVAPAVGRDDFQIRNPFVLPHDGVYYFYESKPWYGGDGVFVRTSNDLEKWNIWGWTFGNV